MIYNFLAVTLNIKEKLVELGDPYKVQNIGLLLSRFVGILLVAAAIAAFFYLIMGGIQWITSGGDKAGTQAAREKITAAFIGLAIVATAWAVFLIIQWFFGFRILGGQGIPSGSGDSKCLSISNCQTFPKGWCAGESYRCICQNGTAIKGSDPWCDYSGKWGHCVGVHHAEYTGDCTR